MVSVYKTFALVGVGSLGSFVAEELLKRGADIKILTRNSRQVRCFRADECAVG